MFSIVGAGASDYIETAKSKALDGIGELTSFPDIESRLEENLLNSSISENESPGGGSRTHTGSDPRQILSLLRLPVPPLRDGMQPLARKAFDFLPAPTLNRFQDQLWMNYALSLRERPSRLPESFLAAFRKSASQTILYRENTESVLRRDTVRAVFCRTPRTGAHGADGSDRFLPFFRPLPPNRGKRKRNFPVP